MSSDIPPPANLSETVSAQYDLMVQQLTLLIQSPVTVSKVLVMLSYSVKFLATIKGLTEPQSIDLALYAVKQVINNSPIITPELKIELLATVDLFGDAVANELLVFAYDTTTFVVDTIKSCNLFSSCKNKTVSAPLVHIRAQTLGDYAGSTEHAALAKYMKLNIQKPFTEPKLVDLLAASVFFMAYYKNLAGLEKKDMVLTVAREVIMSSVNIPDEKKQDFINYVDLIGSQLIDLYVQFGKDVSFKSKSSCCW